MRLPSWIIIITAIAAAALALALGVLLLRPPGSLIVEAGFRPETITPNADGRDDIAEFSYELSRNADITITLEGEDGQIFTFRQSERRIANLYRVNFSGVVAGYTLPGEDIHGEVLRRLMPDGTYTWRLSAVAETGERDERTGTLVVTDGDAPLPEITAFDIEPHIFTPNQDGISDRTQINVFTTKPSELMVYLLGEDDQPIFIPPRVEDARIGEAGMHPYDYEGGVDRNADPPPDGEYTVIALARDAVGQEIQQTGNLTIERGGKPFGQITPQPSGATVVFSTAPWEERFAGEREVLGEQVAEPSDPQDLNLNTLTIPVGDLLIFKLTVENVGRVPLRTTGPAPGTVYDWTQRAATFGLYDESGAWRVGIDCTTAASDYPWRWALGTDDSLITETDPATGEVFQYLPVGATSVVWGAIRMSVLEARNPQNCWAGLIHEDVGVPYQNIGARSIELVIVGDDT
ncbi:MAG: hypothetical protein KC547_00155 [Anaerolineae bacterium]|nr:hypothetical protein [Anaerolineae bacterium]MCA9909897.1 hypothetical protein [Anaerolineae bacterium]